MLLLMASIAGHILIADVLKPNAKKAIAALHRAGIAADSHADREMTASVAAPGGSRNFALLRFTANCCRETR